MRIHADPDPQHWLTHTIYILKNVAPGLNFALDPDPLYQNRTYLIGSRNANSARQKNMESEEPWAHPWCPPASGCAGRTCWSSAGPPARCECPKIVRIMTAEQLPDPDRIRIHWVTRSVFKIRIWIRIHGLKLFSKFEKWENILKMIYFILYDISSRENNIPGTLSAVQKKFVLIQKCFLWKCDILNLKIRIQNPNLGSGSIAFWNTQDSDPYLYNENRSSILNTGTGMEVTHLLEVRLQIASIRRCCFTATRHTIYDYKVAGSETF